MSRLSYTSYDLGYPPWALDFDPYNRGYLLVGGGGGQGQKEVPNRLTLLDVSGRERIEKAAECDVTDDSPASLGVLASKDGMIAFLGANSSAADRKAGKNEHFRSYQIAFPEKVKGVIQSQGKIEARSKCQLFANEYAATGDAFQRLLRLSPAKKSSTGAKRIGAVASSLVQPSEIVLFNATSATPGPKDIIHRIVLPEKAEANDVDIWELGEGEFLVAYCTNKDTFVCSISYDFVKKSLVSKVEIPTSQHETSITGSKYRSIRFLSKDYVLLMANRGAYSELLVLRIYPKEGPGEVVLRRTLANRMQAAVSMDVSLLDADLTTGERQAVVTVAAQRQDIMIFTLVVPSKGSPASFNNFSTLRSVHQAPMKKVVLSSFFSPYETTSGEKKVPVKTPGSQFIQLASISLSNAIVVDTLPLQSRRTKKTPRYVMEKGSIMSGPAGTGASLFVLAFALLVSLIIGQAYLDSKAAERGEVSSIQILPPPLKAFINRQREDNDPLKHVIHEAAEGNVHIPGTRRSLQDLFHLHGQQKAIVVAPPQSGSTDIHTEVHDDHEGVASDPNAKRWDELSTKEQTVWKKRLMDAGQWTTGQGESILQSIFFSELAGAVGRAALGG